MLWEIIIVLLAILWLSQRWRNRAMIKLSNQLKCSYKAFPFVGHSYMLVGTDEDRMNGMISIDRDCMKQGGCMAMWFASNLYITISDPEVAELVLKTCLEKDDVMKITHFIIGNGSIFAPVSIWRPRRKVLAPTFSPKILNQFVEIFYRQSQIMVGQLRPNVGEGTFSIWQYITSYTMDSVCESAIGVRINAQLKPDHPFLKAFDKLCNIGATLMCYPWLHYEFLYKWLPHYKKAVRYKKTISDFVDEVIKSKRKTLSETKTNNNLETSGHSMKTFLEHIIASSGGTNGYSDLELREETLVLVLAGTDTSAVGSSFTCVMLSRHQDVQEKAYQELQEILGDSNRPIVAEDLGRMKYLDAVIRETMRLYPPVPVVARKIDRDIKLPSGVVLLKGCGAFISIWGVHRNPKYWGPDAEIFRPERFIDSPLKHPAAFISFSYGPRACLGYQYAMMSMKMAMASILRRYRILPASPADIERKDEPLRLKYDIMMRHVQNFPVQLELR